jgi:hypothetical protein
MAERPIFIPLYDGVEFVSEIFLKLTWHSGFAPVQKKKNVKALHESASASGYRDVLEISTKSDQIVGNRLSAFHLKVFEIPLESTFQGSKVFENGGPFTDLYTVPVRDAKRDPRLRESGKLIAFQFRNIRFPTEPKTAFYDWLYITALFPFRDWLVNLKRYTAFSDIEFNPAKSINCQARSCALLLSLIKRDMLTEDILQPERFIELLKIHLYPPTPKEASEVAPLWKNPATKGDDPMKIHTPEELEKMTTDDLRFARDIAQGYGSTNQDVGKLRSEERADLIKQILEIQQQRGSSE